MFSCPLYQLLYSPTQRITVDFDTVMDFLYTELVSILLNAFNHGLDGAWRPLLGPAN